MSIRIPDAEVIPGVFDGMCHDYNEKDGTCSAIYHMCSVCPDRKKDTEVINELIDACKGVPYLATSIYELLDRQGLKIVKK